MDIYDIVPSKCFSGFIQGMSIHADLNCGLRTGLCRNRDIIEYETCARVRRLCNRMVTLPHARHAAAERLG